MRFQFNYPSVPVIRAKFVIEKLGNFPRNLGTINLFVTGRTGSGKTTLGNRLLGIDYFLCTGRQDCTQEINLIEFPIGVRYFDLPGVCSDDRLENYNRVAFGMKQVEDFPYVEDLTIAKYTENTQPQNRNINIADFDKFQAEPDLIFYMIAPDKQFARGDRKYLSDLLKYHQQIIYVLNMFVNKQNDSVYLATEANIKDVVTKIVQIHNSALGDDYKPVILGVNCWTGEGISELISHSHIILGNQKGRLFEKIISHQQQKTPDEYLFQVKKELVRLFAYTALQKPDGTYHCNQPIHNACYCLWDFMSELCLKAEQSDYSVVKEVNRLINDFFASSQDKTETEYGDNSVEEDIAYIFYGMNLINELIKYINKEINPPLVASHNEASEFIAKEIDFLKKKDESLQSRLTSLWEEILSHIQRFKSLDEETDFLTQEINSLREKQSSRSFEYNSLQTKIITRKERLDGRIENWKRRLNSYNSAINKINLGYARPTRETINSLESESSYIDREKNFLISEESSIKRQIEILQDKERAYNREKRLIEEKIKSHTTKLSLYNQERNIIQEKLRLHSEQKKSAEDEVGFYIELIKSFEEEYEAISEKMNLRVEQINLRINEIRTLIANLIEEKIQWNSQKINLLPYDINLCIDEMVSFIEEISSFQRGIEFCKEKISINKLVSKAIKNCTTHYFDNTGEFEYKGSSHEHFGQRAIALLLTLSHLIVSGKKIETEYTDLHKKIYDKITESDGFPSELSESKVQIFLNSKLDSLFDSSFDEAVRKVAL